MPEDRQEKNQVFNKPVSTSQKSDSRDISYEVPVERVPLPSQGKIYGPEHPFHNVETVEITAMTAREEDILTSSALIKNGTVVSELIRSCILADVDPNSLLAGDRNSLMIAIRATGYGVDYDSEITCDSCGDKSVRTFNLGELAIKRLDLDPVVAHENVFQFMLPVTKKVVNFRFLTGNVEQEINTVQERQKKVLGSKKDTFVTTNLLYAIISVDGIEDRVKISRFVAMMPAADSQALRKYMRDNEPGIDMKQETQCPACGHLEEVSIPLGAGFFWPSTK